MNKWMIAVIAAGLFGGSPVFAACLKASSMSYDYEATVCEKAENPTTVTKTGTHTVYYSTPGCEGTAPIGTVVDGTSGTSAGGGGILGGIGGGGGGGIGGSYSVIDPEGCVTCAGGSGTAGGDNGNSASPPEVGGPSDEGCGGDEGDKCKNQCEPVKQKTGSEVILTNGTYTFDAVDLKVAARGMDVILRRTYRSNRIYDTAAGPVFGQPVDGPFGFGWQTPFSVKIVNGDTFVDADGRYFTFKKDAAGNFLPEMKAGLTLSKTPSGFVLVKLDSFTRYFDADGRLLRKEDNFGNKWLLNYDANQRLVSVADGAGREVFYFAYGGDDHVISVTDLSGRVVYYAYDGFGNLQTVTDAAGHDTTYTYNGYHGILSKANPLGETYTIDYQYPDKGVVKSVIDPIGTANLQAGQPVGNHVVVNQYVFANKTFLVTDKNGQQIETRVNSDGLPTQTVEVATGTVLSNIEYLDNRLERHTDEAGNVTLKQKDEWGNLLRKVDGEGNEWRYTYTTGNRLASSTDPIGVVTRYEYDSKGNVTRQIQAADTTEAITTDYTYDAYGQLTSRSSGGATTRYSYNDAGLLQTITDPLGHVERMEYDAVGNMTAQIDALGNRTVMTYDDQGNLLTVKDPLGHISSRSYTSTGKLEQMTDPLGRTTTYEIDDDGRITAVIDALDQRREIEYDAAGNVVKTINGDAVTSMAYDARGRLLSVTDAEGNITSYEYVEGGCSSCGGDTSTPQRIIDPFGQAVENTFDKNGRVIAILDPLQNLTRREFDPRGQVARRIDANGNAITYSYDLFGRVSSQTDALGGVTTFAYDVRGNLLSITDPKGNITVFEYDLAGRKTKEIRSMGQVTFYSYAANGLVKTVTDAKGQITTFNYDDGNRLIGVVYADGKRDAFVYDTVGNMSSWSGAGGVNGTIIYDDLNRKLRETVDYGDFSKTIAYSYDAYGNKASYTSPEGVEHVYSYDKNGRLTALTFDGNAVTLTYDKNRLKQIETSNSVLTEYNYNASGWITGIHADRLNEIILDRNYSLDGMGNIESLQNENGSYIYVYDDSYQLTSVDSSQMAEENYTYDAVGNRLTSADTSVPWSYSGNNQLLGYDDISYEYDANGNTIRSGSQTYIYNTQNRLESVGLPDGRVVNYAYDPFGRLFKKWTGGFESYYVYSEEGLAGEYDVNGVLRVSYGWKPQGMWGTDPLYLFKEGSYYFYHNDHRGAPLKLVNSSGEVVWWGEYSAFGGIVNEASSVVENNLRLPGQYYDQDTGLNHNWFRDYSAKLGRFLQPDPIGMAGGINQYIYVKNNPMKFIDPNGLCGTTREVGGGFGLGLGLWYVSASVETEACCDENNLRHERTLQRICFGWEIGLSIKGSAGATGLVSDRRSVGKCPSLFDDDSYYEEEGGGVWGAIVIGRSYDIDKGEGAWSSGLGGGYRITGGCKVRIISDVIVGNCCE